MNEAQDKQKQAVAAAALAYIADDCRLGVGTGSTVNHFIALLDGVRGKISAVLPTSRQTARRLEAAGFRCNDGLPELDVYVDGADEADDNFQLLKGGGGAHSREKVAAEMARRFVCIVDKSKRVGRLGRFPLPVEVLPPARSFVARKLAAMGGTPTWREGFVTDNGGWILDVANLDIVNAAQMERDINIIAGVVDCGLFAGRRPDVLLTADADGVHTQTR